VIALPIFLQETYCFNKQLSETQHFNWIQSNRYIDD